MIIIEDYNPKWAENFKLLKGMYERNICNVDIEILHIGSTSVKGLCAKPIIDISIIYYDDSDFENIKKQLEYIGYKHRGDLGITNREAFKYIGNEDLPSHHLYVCLNGILSIRNSVLFRNYLREHKDAAKEYCRIKRELAKQYEIVEYCYYKTEFITGILKKCGLTKDEITEIIKMNEI